MDTQLEIRVDSEDYITAESVTKRLKNKLLDIDDVRVTQLRKEIQPGQAGGLLDTALNLVFGADTFSKILDILKEIIKGKDKKTSISVKCHNGASLEITEENIKDGLLTPEMIIKFCEGSKGE